MFNARRSPARRSPRADRAGEPEPVAGRAEQIGAWNAFLRPGGEAGYRPQKP